MVGGVGNEGDDVGNSGNADHEGACGGVMEGREEGVEGDRSPGIDRKKWMGWM